MKQPIWSSILRAAGALAGAGLVGGCPAYNQKGCDFENNPCAAGFECDRDTGTCAPAVPDTPCDGADGCGPNETCGADARCHPGSCLFHGCPDGFECGVSGSSTTCVESGAAERDASRSETSTDGATDAQLLDARTDRVAQSEDAMSGDAI